MGTVSHQLSGTGFVIGDGHYVVTNHHVVTTALDKKVKSGRVVFVPKGKRAEIIPIEQIFTDEEHDIAIVKIGKALPAVNMVAADTIIDDGEDIAITGFPIGGILGLYAATHKGIVAAYTPNIIAAQNSQQLSEQFLQHIRNPFMVYQLDIVAYPGNSGSPVYLAGSGKVIAVINKVFVKETKESAITSPSGITYAVPISHVYALAKKHNIL
ncbi:trypsin-like peptidase domain-containing protein [Alteromonas pelagimontana]|uniref:Trypsin-like peptidase domain-containing protein n=2 Tax=Alteromonas pelagimontana TaxID=1858656 RepID=A0A6M4MIE4_9ALTE|nr:trypsin-like peptidase domain-containing protein [Alteromonas pelagimontana]